MLITLCHRCWSWVEPKHERCVECGCPIDLQEPDPTTEQLQEMFAQPICVIGEVSLKRGTLPSAGTLTAFENGLLFLPDLRRLPSGGVAAVEPVSGHSTDTGRPGFWNLLIRRTSSSVIDSPSAARPEITLPIAVERFFDSPGAFFVRRDAILRIFQRGSLLRVERKPGRTVAFRILSSWAASSEEILRWRSSRGWQSVVMMLNG